MKQSEIFLEAYTTLLGNVTGNMVQVTFQMERRSVVLYHAYTFDEPTEFDRECLSDAACEFTTKFPVKISYKCDLEKAADPTYLLGRYRHCIFARATHDS